MNKSIEGVTGDRNGGTVGMYNTLVLNLGGYATKKYQDLGRECESYLLWFVLQTIVDVLL